MIKPDISQLVTAGVVVIGLALYFLFSAVRVGEPIPPYADVWGDDKRRVFVTPPCMKIASIASRFESAPFLLKLYEAQQEKYQEDAECRNKDGYIGGNWSFGWGVLASYGVVPNPSRFGEHGTWKW